MAANYMEENKNGQLSASEGIKDAGMASGLDGAEFAEDFSADKFIEDTVKVDSEDLVDFADRDRSVSEGDSELKSSSEDLSASLTREELPTSPEPNVALVPLDAIKEHALSEAEKVYKEAEKQLLFWVSNVGGDTTELKDQLLKVQSLVAESIQKA